MRSEEFWRVEQPPTPIVIDDEEEYKVEAILKHNGKGSSGSVSGALERLSSHRV